MKKFSNYADYETWTDSFDNCSDYEMTPVVIDDGWRICMDMFTECKSWKTALKRFEKAFDSIPAEAGLHDWVECIRESCENNFFHDSSDGIGRHNYAYGVEETSEGLWYIFLNISGIYAGRNEAEN